MLKCTSLEGATFFLERYKLSKRLLKLSHSIYECKYHVVFCPKFRYRIFTQDIAEYTKPQIYQLCRQKELIEVLELNVQPDHVHLVIEIPPKYCVSDFMGYLLGKLALRLFSRYEKLGRRYWGRHLWSRGYCVSTIGLDEEKIRLYVKWQQQKEKLVETTEPNRVNQ